MPEIKRTNRSAPKSTTTYDTIPAGPPGETPDQWVERMRASRIAREALIQSGKLASEEPDYDEINKIDAETNSRY